MGALADKCCDIYSDSRDGQAAVEEFIQKNHPEVPWRYCDACESSEPSEGKCCLVCGSETEMEYELRIARFTGRAYWAPKET